MVYADASALVKLVLREPEALALTVSLARAGPICSSIVGAVEVLVVARRGRGPEGLAQAEAVLECVELLDLDLAIARGAAALEALRSLDAIHLASALALGDDLEGLVTYDRRLAEAARQAGLDVLAPA